MEGLRLASSFSLITNQLRYCGPKGAHQEMYDLLSGNTYDKTKLVEHFRRFEGLYVYLDHMANKVGRHFLDKEIVEAYFIGNSLLERFDDNDLKEIIKRLAKRGLPEQYADILIKNLPKGMNPSHSFNVLYVGVGKVTGSVPTNIQTMDNCIISKARVTKVSKKLSLEIMPLTLIEGAIGFKEPRPIETDFDPLLLAPREGDYVGMHWGRPCALLTQKQQKNLDTYLKRNIDALNRALFFSTAQG